MLCRRCWRWTSLAEPRGWVRSRCCETKLSSLSTAWWSKSFERVPLLQHVERIMNDLKVILEPFSHPGVTYLYPSLRRWTKFVTTVPLQPWGATWTRHLALRSRLHSLPPTTTFRYIRPVWSSVKLILWKETESNSKILNLCESTECFFPLVYFIAEWKPEDWGWDCLQRCSRHLHRIQAPSGVRQAD